MTGKLRTAALIMAAGTGERAKRHTSDTAKQFRTLSGISVLQRTINAFADHARIDVVLVVVNPDSMGDYKVCVSQHGDTLLPPVAGGPTRQQSVYQGLKGLRGADVDKVLIHDAVRPFVDDLLIGRVVDALENEDNVLPVLPVADTLVRGADSYRVGAVDRSDVFRAQTPQGFRYKKILKAHDAAEQAGRTDFTDDCSLGDWHGMRAHMVPGSAKNFKLTNNEDFELAEALITMQDSDKQEGTSSMPPSIRVGNGYDVHAFEPGDAVILCGVSIPHDKRLKGHSDADVGLHAITDALFGALGDGDIGSHFPPSDPQWAGADSAVFLKHAAERVTARQGIIEHIDVTLICEAPKVGPYRDSMRARIGSIVNVPVERISVKATTTERLGFTGREEGIAAMASATVRLG